ncbi:hypothetical protein [Mucilaginibacter paludis]|uniref:Uncharacterized protein n=1 Tax=Mucilaginibacter paludis DSM 18603 TaxID=714943 RepID=H1Y108_9SPHI|nr:hypothetical protein [Mucilaginibacter paludis]EHQ29233.1 hypothetical protein Mucpa_5158 [Mucilaginibacter paludis DSM 18603]
MENTTATRVNVQEEPYLQQIYIETGHWLNDMSFYDDEIRFLKAVLDKYFILLLSDEHVNRVQLISAHLGKTDVIKSLIKDEILKHRENLDATLKNSVPNREDFLALEHTRLRDELTEMTRNFKDVKHEIFKISEVAIKSEKLSNLA